MKCFERDPIKRLDVKGIIKYQDSLEMISYGDYVSQNNFEKILAESQIRSEPGKSTTRTKVWTCVTTLGSLASPTLSRTDPRMETMQMRIKNPPMLNPKTTTKIKRIRTLIS
jgi:hypothetical protein